MKSIPNIILSLFPGYLCSKFFFSFVMRCYAEVMHYSRESEITSLCALHPPHRDDLDGQQKCLDAQREVKRIGSVIPTVIGIAKNTVEETSICPYYESCPKLLTDFIDTVSSPWVIAKFVIITLIITLLAHFIINLIFVNNNNNNNNKNQEKKKDSSKKKKGDESEKSMRSMFRMLMLLKSIGTGFYNPMALIKKLPFPLRKKGPVKEGNRYKNVSRKQSIEPENIDNTDDEGIHPVYSDWQDWVNEDREEYIHSVVEEEQPVPFYNISPQITAYNNKNGVIVKKNN